MNEKLLTTNFGFLPDKEKAELLGTEWCFGAASQTCIAAVPLEKRAQYLPEGELQNMGEEKSDCVTRAYLNILETKLTYVYETQKLMPQTRKWLEDHEYVQNGRVVLSDAFNAILSGTTRQGNSLKAPVDSMHHDGVIPKKLLPQLQTWDEHNDPARITQKLRDLGQEFLRRLPINYDQVNLTDLDVALKYDMSALGGFAWPDEVNGEYQRVDYSFNHAFMGYGLPKVYIFDNYVDDDFVKKLAPNYKLFDYGYRVYISAERIVDIALPDVTQNTGPIVENWWTKLLRKLHVK